jgi:hypothetical protein
MKINDHYQLQVGRAQWTYGSKQLYVKCTVSEDAFIDITIIVLYC